MAVTTSIPPVPRDQRATISGPLILTPTYGNGGWFTVSCSTHIEAPPHVVLEVLLDHANWGTWNRLVTRNTVVSQPPPASSTIPFTGPKYISTGTDMLCEVHLDLSPISKPRIEPEHVTAVEQFSESNAQSGWRVAWITTGMSRYLLGIERVQEMVNDGQNNTEYTTWETYFGILAPVVRVLMGLKIERGFDAWMDGLKERAESFKK